MPNSHRGVFASSGFAGYWRRVQKSFSNYIGSSKIRRVPDPNILSTPTSTDAYPSLLLVLYLLP